MSSPNSSFIPNPLAVISLPDDIPHPPLRKPQRWPKRLLYVFLVLLAVAAAGAGFLYWQAQQLVNEFQAGQKKAVVQAAIPQLNVTPPNRYPGITKAETILLIGADHRYQSPGVGNSDTIILARINPKNDTVSLLSLPRDLYVNIPGYGMGKINAAYAYGGPALLIETVRDFIGIGINHFIQLDFGGFQSLISTLGGVYLPIDQQYFHISSGTGADDWSSVDIQPGYQKMKGPLALEWVRFRHFDSDFYRVARQQLFLSTVAQQMRQQVTDLSKNQALVNLK